MLHGERWSISLIEAADQGAVSPRLRPNAANQFCTTSSWFAKLPCAPIANALWERRTSRKRLPSGAISKAART